MVRLPPSPSSSPDEALVLAKATVRAATGLGMSGEALGETIGAREAALTRIMDGMCGVDPNSKEGELAALLVRLYRSLDCLVGNDAAARLAWMQSYNRALNGVPQESIRTGQGLVRAVDYLERMSAPL